MGLLTFWCASDAKKFQIYQIWFSSVIKNDLRSAHAGLQGWSRCLKHIPIRERSSSACVHVLIQRTQRRDRCVKKMRNHHDDARRGAALASLRRNRSSPASGTDRERVGVGLERLSDENKLRRVQNTREDRTTARAGQLIGGAAPPKQQRYVVLFEGGSMQSEGVGLNKNNNKETKAIKKCDQTQKLFSFWLYTKWLICGLSASWTLAAVRVLILRAADLLGGVSGIPLLSLLSSFTGGVVWLSAWRTALWKITSEV